MSDNKKIKFETIKNEFNSKINILQTKIKLLSQDIKKNKTEADKYTALAIIIYHLSIIELYFEHNQAYYSFFNRNSDQILDKIRKEFSSISAITRSFFGHGIPDSLAKHSNSLEKMSPTRLLNLLKKMDMLYNKLAQAYGVNSRYVTTITSIYGSICEFMLHMVDFKSYIQRSKNLADPENLEIKKLLSFVTDLLLKAGNLYMQSYNLTNSKALILESIAYLNCTEKLLRMLNDPRLEELERKKNSWKRMLSE